MESALNILSDEHQNIIKVINALLNECNSLESGKEIDNDFFIRVIEFVREYADKFHHAKEEDILFVELCKDEIQMHCNPIQQMLYEHDKGRNFIKQLEKSIEKKDKNKIIENARGYAQLLQEHIFKEDNILYPMADNALNQEIKRMMLDKFKRIEENSIKQKNKHIFFVQEISKKQ